MLQSSYSGALAEGESRESSETSVDSCGNISLQQLVQRTTTHPDGQAVVVLQAHNLVQVPGFDQNVLLGAITASRNDIKSDVKELKKDVMIQVDTVVRKENNARMQADRTMKAEFRGEVASPG